jgi:hypothetical protein
LTEEVRKRDILKLAADNGRSGESRGGTLNNGGHDVKSSEKKGTDGRGKGAVRCQNREERRYGMARVPYKLISTPKTR